MSRRMLAHRVVMLLLRLRCLPSRRRPRTSGGAPVSVFVLNAHGSGGAARSAFYVAGSLAKDRTVDIISVIRAEEEPLFSPPESVRLRVLDNRLDDRLSFVRRRLSAMPSVLIHPDDELVRWFSLWTDLLLYRQLRAVPPGSVAIVTRPSFAILAARVLRDGVGVVVHDHINFASFQGDMPRAVRASYPHVDAVVLLTDRDRASYEAWLASSRVGLVTIPNSVPALPGKPRPVDGRRNVIVAAGRLNAQKGFDLLVQAYALVHKRHPEWQLEIYGDGRQRAALEELISSTGLSSSVSLMGLTKNLSEVMARSSIFALSSRFEGMPMVLLEAMSKGMAVVAFDCPTGPRELISSGDDGILVAPGDVAAFAQALGDLIDDEPLRASLSARAIATAAEYGPEAIGRRWRDLLDGLTSAQEDEPAAQPATPSATPLSRRSADGSSR